MTLSHVWPISQWSSGQCPDRCWFWLISWVVWITLELHGLVGRGMDSSILWKMDEEKLPKRNYIRWELWNSCSIFFVKWKRRNYPFNLKRTHIQVVSSGNTTFSGAPCHTSVSLKHGRGETTHLIGTEPASKLYLLATQPFVEHLATPQHVSFWQVINL